jgi:hypothetical protein
MLLRYGSVGTSTRAFMIRGEGESSNAVFLAVQCHFRFVLFAQCFTLVET